MSFATQTGCIPKCVLPLLLLMVVRPATATADESCVHFDVPALVECCDVTDEPFRDLHPDERLIQLTVHCSTLVDCKQRQKVLELMLRLRGLSGRFPVVDYLPQTQLHSSIDGPISVEERNESSGSLGLEASGTYNQMIRLGGSAKAGQTSGLVRRYQEVPEQQILLSSGTIERGSGVYFKFRESAQTTLEGGHTLILTLRVPSNWRSGLMRVDCLATGEEKYLVGTDDQFVAGKQTFVVALYLKGDLRARQVAADYARIEADLRKHARASINNQSDLMKPLVSWLNHSAGQPPEAWAEEFMLYNSRRIQTSIRPHISKSLQRATDQFLVARRELLRLNR